MEFAIVDIVQSSMRARTSKTRHKLKLGLIRCHYEMCRVDLYLLSHYEIEVAYIVWDTTLFALSYGIG